jgi:glycosyltransferase involved in cell wall biosynthesis
LLCTTTITQRKRVVELAQAAILAQTPVWIVGEPYAETDPYAQQFRELARQHPQTLRYEGPIADRARLAAVYREARGFVLLSAMESLSLSALEAAACGCSLLLSDLPWARTFFGQSVSYCAVTPDTARTAASLRKFYDAAPGLTPPPAPPTWRDVATQLKRLYETLASTSR